MRIQMCMQRQGGGQIKVAGCESIWRLLTVHHRHTRVGQWPNECSWQSLLVANLQAAKSASSAYKDGEMAKSRL